MSKARTTLYRRDNLLLGVDARFRIHPLDLVQDVHEFIFDVPNHVLGLQAFVQQDTG